MERKVMIANRYEFNGSLDDTGGMGEILSYTDTHLQRKVVLKKLQDGVESRRLLDEQKCLAKLRSKHVVQLYDIVDFNGPNGMSKAIVLEYIDGKTLTNNSFSDDTQLLHVLWQISCGLSDIHSFKIIHRDIKPQNLKIDSEGIVKILDFGLSRSDDEAVTRSIIGTPIFMAPELWGDKTISFSSSVDVYAFGVTSLALVDKTPPPALCSRPPRPIEYSDFESRLSHFQPEIVNILFQCLSHDPKLRPSMKEVSDVLKKHLLFNKHKATVVLNGTVNILNDKNRKIQLNANVGQLAIEYDGLNFTVANVSGDVSVNNNNVSIGSIIPGCSVLTFGSTPGTRKFVTFDVSNPEVIP